MHEELASTHKETSAEDRYNLDVKDQQNQEAASSTLSYQVVHVEKHSSHQADGSANGVIQQD